LGLKVKVIFYGATWLLGSRERCFQWNTALGKNEHL